MEEKKTRGGARRSGRTQTPKTYRIDNDLIDQLSSMENANKFVNEAIREKLNNK